MMRLGSKWWNSAGLTLLWVCLSPMMAQQQPAAPEEPCTVKGQVVHASTGEPLRKVNLVLQGSGRDGTYATRSDAGGRFEFLNVPPGRYRISGERVGFIRQNYSARGVSFSGTTITLSAGQTLDDILFKLTPQGVITGTIRDEDGDPVPGVSVQALQRRYVDGKRQLMPVGGGRSNDIGEYRLAQMKPGRYYLSASYSRRSFGFRARQPEMAPDNYVATFYPAATEATSAVPIEVGAGVQLRDIDIRLQKMRVVSVRGRVIDGRNSSPARDVAVMLSPRGAGFSYAARRASATRSNADGTFEIRGVPAGSYILSVNRSGRGRGRGRPDQSGVARLPVEIGESDVEGLEVVIRDPLELSGVVRMEPDEQVSLRGMRLTLIPADGITSGRASARMEEDAGFRVLGLIPDNYRLSVYGLPEGTYLKSARLGNQEVLESGVDLTAGVAPGPLQLLLSSRAAAVSGVVVDDDQQPAAGVTVTLVPDSDRWSQTHLFKTAGTDQNGMFRLSGIAPGDYELYAWEQIESGAHQDPEFLEPFTDDGASISVEENSLETVQLEMITAEAVEQQ